MTRKNVSKLNYFMASTPSGVVLTTQWLERQGISSKLAWWYVNSGLLERLGVKAYKKAGDHIFWTGVVSAMQEQLFLHVHVGGQTALQILGRAHFIPMQGMKQVMLFADLNTKVPSWFINKEKWDVEFELVKTSLFHNRDKSLGIMQKSINGISIQISCPERAIMEVLYLSPKYHSFEDVVLLIENLSQLRPMIVQSLLEKCKSIKVKRLFLYLTEKFHPELLSNLNLRKIKLGHGKRVIDGGGEYDSKYMLSLPKMKEEESGF